MLRPSPLAILRFTALFFFVAVFPAASQSDLHFGEPAARNAETGDQSNPDFSDAVCPVVYQLDESPGMRGYHYIFYGNAFFINREGYLLTAAHVLSEFHNGGQPSILLRLAAAPPRMLKASVVDVDAEHDVAILRVTPNPFTGPYDVLSLPLAARQPNHGQSIVVSALRPSHLRNPETYELPVTDTYNAVVLDYRSMSLSPENARASAKENSNLPQSLAGSRKALTDIFLFSHEVQLGQSGSPVVSATTHQVVGLIEGRWLHPTAVPADPAAAGSPASGSASANSIPAAKNVVSPAPRPLPILTQGAAVPITYALALLERNHISWDTASQQP